MLCIRFEIRNSVIERRYCGAVVAGVYAVQPLYNESHKIYGHRWNVEWLDGNCNVQWFAAIVINDPNKEKT